MIVGMTVSANHRVPQVQRAGRPTALAVGHPSPTRLRADLLAKPDVRGSLSP